MQNKNSFPNQKINYHFWRIIHERNNENNNVVVEVEVG